MRTREMSWVRRGIDSCSPAASTRRGTICVSATLTPGRRASGSSRPPRTSGCRPSARTTPSRPRSSCGQESPAAQGSADGAHERLPRAADAGAGWHGRLRAAGLQDGCNGGAAGGGGVPGLVAERPLARRESGPHSLERYTRHAQPLPVVSFGLGPQGRREAAPEFPDERITNAGCTGSATAGQCTPMSCLCCIFWDTLRVRGSPNCTVPEVASPHSGPCDQGTYSFAVSSGWPPATRVTNEISEQVCTNCANTPDPGTGSTSRSEANDSSCCCRVATRVPKSGISSWPDP